MIAPSDAASDPLWVFAHLVFDSMQDRDMDLIEDVPRVITRLQYIHQAELRRRAHLESDERWRADTNAALEAMRAGAVVR